MTQRCTESTAVVVSGIPVESPAATVLNGRTGVVPGKYRSLWDLPNLPGLDVTLDGPLTDAELRTLARSGFSSEHTDPTTVRIVPAFLILARPEHVLQSRNCVDQAAAVEVPWEQILGPLTDAEIQRAAAATFTHATADQAHVEFEYDITDPVVDADTAHRAAAELTDWYGRWAYGDDLPDDGRLDGDEYDVEQNLLAALAVRRGTAVQVRAVAATR